MKPLLLLIGTVIFFAGIGFAVDSAVATYRIEQELKELDLADDASTPQQKSVFLGAFIDHMESRHLPEHAAFIFENERNRVSNQIDVLKSLKKRCDDLSKVDPASLGYAQGMTQLSGQEFDHATGSVSSIFDDAMTVQQGWFTFYGWMPLMAIGVLIGAAGLFGS